MRTELLGSDFLGSIVGKSEHPYHTAKSTDNLQKRLEDIQKDILQPLVMVLVMPQIYASTSAHDRLTTKQTTHLPARWPSYSQSSPIVARLANGLHWLHIGLV
jgi:hypothetical protein